MRQDFDKIHWNGVSMKLREPKKYARGVWYKGYYADGERVFPQSIPEGYHMYECRHDDDGNWCDPVTVNHSVLVNFAGTFICKEELPIPNIKFLSFLEVMAWEYTDFDPGEIK